MAAAAAAKQRHSLEYLRELATWVSANDINTHSLTAWDALHAKVLTLSGDSYLDITNIKSNAKGAKMVRGAPAGYTKHDKLHLVFKDESAYKLYEDGTGVNFTAEPAGGN
jgi:hypothetical protein